MFEKSTTTTLKGRLDDQRGARVGDPRPMGASMSKIDWHPSRRDVLRTAAIAGAGATIGAAASGAAGPAFAAARSSADRGDGGESAFDIPRAAVTRPLGVIPVGPLTPGFPGLPISVPGLGIPLGGVGAGSFMINQAGTFGPWFFGGSQDDSWEMRALPQAAFHVREQIGKAAPSLRTLATAGPQSTGPGATLPQRAWQSPLPAWNILSPGDGTYSTLYPFGWTTYKTLQTDVSMRFFSPIVAGEERRSSLPIAYFDVRVANPTSSPAAVSVMFTMPNVAAHEGRQPATIREGLDARYVTDHRTGVSGVTLSSTASVNTPDATASEWTIGVRPKPGQHASYVTSWNADGDGSDIYGAFDRTGILPNKALDATFSAGAVSVTVRLAPGESTIIPFVLTWDFPQVAYADNNTVWMRRYTDFYGARQSAQNDYIAGSYPFHQSFAIARDALAGHDQAVGDVEAWCRPIAEEPAYSSLLIGSALNQLAQVTWKTSLWAAGLVSNGVRPTGGKRLGTSFSGMHPYLGVDSNAGGGANGGEGTEVGTYSYLGKTMVFPAIERDLLLAKIEAVDADPWGDPWDPAMTASVNPADYQATGDPFITWTQGSRPSPGNVWFIDRPSENIFRIYDYARRNKDREFLADGFPAMRKLLGYIQATIPGGSHLPQAPSMLDPSPELKSPLPYANVFDVIPVNRFDAYDTQLYLLALEAMIATAEWLGDRSGAISTWTSTLRDAKADYEATFWNPDHGYYRYTPGPGDDDDAVLLATLFAQNLAERSGLPDLIDLDRYRQHLLTVTRLSTSELDAGGRPIGYPTMSLPTGATDYPYVGSLGLVFEKGVWPAVNEIAGTNCIRAANRFGDNALRMFGLQLGTAVSLQIWEVAENGYAFNAPIQWNMTNAGEYIYPSFETDLAIWELLDAIKPLRL
jgi:uncharacterized protein (DUF608 family)